MDVWLIGFSDHERLPDVNLLDDDALFVLKVPLIQGTGSRLYATLSLTLSVFQSKSVYAGYLMYIK